MKHINTSLICLFVICAIPLFANDPNDAYISGPTRVMAGLQNVRYTLNNFDYNDYIYCIWYFEDTVSHIITSNVVYTGRITTTFDMPIAQTAILIDVEVYYVDKNLNQIVMHDYVIGVTTFFMTISIISRKGLDGNYYNNLNDSAPIHYNIDNDVESNNGDYHYINPSGIADDDLLPLSFQLDPPNVYTGDNSFLEVGVSGANLKLWSNQKKSGLFVKSNHNFVRYGPDLYCISLVTFYAEACSLGASSVNVYINGGQIGSISYNAYAVTDGTQPTKLEKQTLEYQTLVGCEWSFIDSSVNPVSSYFHSSLAYAVDPNCLKFGVPFIVQKTTPRVITPTGLVTSNYCGYTAYYTNVDAFWNANYTFEFNDLLSFFTSPIWLSNYEWTSSYGDIIYYSDFHAARKYSGCSGIMPTWRMYKSKYIADKIFIYRDCQLDEGTISLRLNEESVVE